MASHSFRDSLRLIYREAVRSPWICRAALSDGGDRTPAPAASAAAPVLVLGGLFSHPRYYAALGRALARRGYAVHFDGEGFNARSFRPHLADLRRRLEAIHAGAGVPVRLVGHSLGGLHAMALLAECPVAVEHVVAVATPVVGGTPWEPLERVAERILDVRASDAERLRQRIAPYAGRITTISAPEDLVAPPLACALAGAHNVVLRTLPRPDRSLATHGGLIFMRTVREVVASALGAPAEWRRAS